MTKPTAKKEVGFVYYKGVSRGMYSGDNSHHTKERTRL